MQRSRVLLGTSLEPLSGTPFVTAHGEEDDHLRIIVLLATHLGRPGDADVRACTDPRSTWRERREGLEELLRRTQKQCTGDTFAGLVDPDALPLPESRSDPWDDASFRRERSETFQILLRSFERGGWVLIRPEPVPETTLALNGWGCSLVQPGIPAPRTADDAQLNRAMIHLSPAMQALLLGLVNTGRMEVRWAVALMEACAPEHAEIVAFERASSFWGWRRTQSGSRRMGADPASRRISWKPSHS